MSIPCNHKLIVAKLITLETSFFFKYLSCEPCFKLKFLMIMRLHNLYSSPNIIRQIKSRRMRWAGHVARTGEDRKMYRVSVEILKERDHLEDRGVDGKMGSEWILGRLAGGLDSTGLDRDCWRAVEDAMMNLRVLASRS
jgi:hypothetical protein